MGRMPAGLLFELGHIALGVAFVTVGGQAHRNQGRRQPLKFGTVFAGKVDNTILVLAHVHGRCHDDGIRPIRKWCLRSA
ncbi:MAG: hypothetical protein NVS2B15_14470 [Pseudarthrobacter sp.]